MSFRNFLFCLVLVTIQYLKQLIVTMNNYKVIPCSKYYYAVIYYNCAFLLLRYPYSNV